MNLGFLTRSIRTKLLVSLTVVLVGATIGTNLVVTRLQASRLEAGSVEMAGSMMAGAEALQADLLQTGKDMAALTAEEAGASGAALADLLAQVAPAAILSNDFMALTNYVRGVNENPGVAYAAFLSKDGKTLTRYLDREKPSLQPLLVDEAGNTRNLAQVIEASRSRDGLSVYEKPITVEGQALGTAILCLDRAGAAARLAQIDSRFADLSEKQKSSVREAGDLVRGTGKKVAAESAAVLWFGAAVSMLLALGVAYWNMTGVLHGLRGIIGMLQGISEGEGDLTQRLVVKSHDELEDVAGWFNQFVEKTRLLVAEVKDASIGLASMAEELSSTTVHIAEGAREVSTQAESAATAAEEMSSTVEDVARTTHEVGLAASAADDAARNGEEVIQESGRAMDEITTVVGSAAETVRSLGEAADKITIVTEVIHDIADQTNLLALNAAIEAARAGEHGRGFAVVADEVRGLAEKTVKATGEISGLIAAIISESQRAVAAMSRGNEAVHRGQDYGRQVGEAIEGIRARVSNVAEQTGQISAAIEELAATNHETAKNVVGIAHEVGSTSSAAAEISSTSEELSRRAEGLRQLTGRFRT